jgi:hypothetical protein
MPPTSRRWSSRSAARQHRATDRLARAAPASQTLLIRAAERGAITAALMRLLGRTSATDLQLAILDALERDVPHPNAVRLALERRREQRGEAPQVAVVLPAHVQAVTRRCSRMHSKPMTS